jgi:hypothetical protein
VGLHHRGGVGIGMKEAGAVALVVAFIALAIGCEVMNWQECLRDHPWWHCLRLLSK